MSDEILKRVQVVVEEIKVLLKDQDLSDHQDITFSNQLMEALSCLWSARCDLKIALNNDRS